jgi:hypothetical protein
MRSCRGRRAGRPEPIDESSLSPFVGRFLDGSFQLRSSNIARFDGDTNAAWGIGRLRGPATANVGTLMYDLAW